MADIDDAQAIAPDGARLAVLQTVGASSAQRTPEFVGASAS